MWRARVTLLPIEVVISCWSEATGLPSHYSRNLPSWRSKRQCLSCRLWWSSNSYDLSFSTCTPCRWAIREVGVTYCPLKMPFRGLGRKGLLKSFLETTSLTSRTHVAPVVAICWSTRVLLSTSHFVLNARHIILYFVAKAFPHLIWVVGSGISWCSFQSN